MKLIAMNDLNRRIGEGHGRDKLTDHDVELILGLLDARRVLMAEYRKVGLSRGFINGKLHEAQLSYSGIAEKFEVSKSHIAWLAWGLRRGQYAARWVRAGVKP